MNLSELINEILSEWAYRVDDGQPNPKNEKHLAQLSIVLSEMGLSDIKAELFEKIEEADKKFTNPILNKEIPYKGADGTQKTGIVGNLLRLPKDSPGRVAAEKLMPPEGSDERDSAMQDLGSEKDGKSTGGDKEKGKEDEKGKEGGGETGGEEEKAKAAQAMFDPKADPAMGARLDREKAASDKIVQKDKDDAEAEKDASTSTKDETPADTFTPIDAKEVNTEMPQADPETFGGGSDIPDGIQPEELHQFNTDIKKVAQIVAKAKENNQPIPDINLCDITVPGTNLYCDDNLGIPRDEMPQFKGKAEPGSRADSMEADSNGEVDTEPIFRKMLDDKGVKVLQTEIPADRLKATQKDLVGAKVIGMMGALEKDPTNPKITAPIYVSRDGYVIDGHHRWAAIVAYNAQHPDNQIPMKTTVLDMDIKDAIPMANKFAEDMGIASKKASANAEAPTTDEKLPQPEPADETPGGIVYNVGGNYYSDTPDGPAQYVKTESIVNGFLLEGEEKWIHLLFEKTVTKVTSSGNNITVSVIEPKDQEQATDAADTAEKESGRQEIDSPKTEKERQAMRAFTDKSVTDSLSLTKSDVEKQEKKAKLDLLKKIDAWEKRKAKAKAKGEKFTEKKPTTESKGVGLGSPESRAGESAVVKGTIELKKAFDKCMAKSKDVDKCYQSAREATRKNLETYLGSDTFLTKEWIDSAMNTIDLIHKQIGFDKIEEIGWDNQEGRALVGSQGHGTSADMFIKMKPDADYPNGKRLGISLKKDLKVFIFNGGWKKLEGELQDKGFILGESSKASHYEKRRNEELHQVSNFAETNKDEFCKDFNNMRANPDRLSSKPGTVKSRVADILKLTKASDLSKVKCDNFIQNIVSARPLSGDAMKIVGDMCKTSTNPYLKAAYGKMRAIDREMTDSIADDFDKPENQMVVKKLVRDETHITDILFADNPNLDELKVVYGTNPAIEMRKEELSKLFGVDDLYAKYEAETDPAKKAKIRKQIEDTIDSKIVISRKKGVMSVAINVTDADGKPSQLPLFEAKIRTRGFGSSPTFEMSQNTFGGISYKYGHTDYNGVGVDSMGNPNTPWSDEDKSIVVISMLGDITNDFEEDLDSLDEKTMAEIGVRLQDLDKIYPNHPKVRLFRKKYLESAKQPIGRPVPKTANKKPATKTPAKAPVKKASTKTPVKKTPAKAPVKKVRR